MKSISRAWVIPPLLLLLLAGQMADNLALGAGINLAAFFVALLTLAPRQR